MRGPAAGRTGARRGTPGVAATAGRLWVLVWLCACGGRDVPPDASAGAAAGAPSTAAESPPPPPPARLRPIIGDYASSGDTVSLLEDGGRLVLQWWGGERTELRAEPDSTFEAADPAGRLDGPLTIRRAGGRVTGVELNGQTWDRLVFGPENGASFRIVPVGSPEALRAEALAATPPLEEGDFREPDLVELTSLDPTVLLDIRYATTNNFMGEVFYSAPRAFLQRPAADALVRAHEWLGERGYGLLIHDGYRPWYVTKMFWEATPEDLRVFVADPSSGSRHNRGCAVDLTLYDRATGEPIVMTGGYDEFSPRSYPDYPGGTTRQRWHRELLREAMEMQGFTVYEAEWWHFDYRDWRSYRIGNQRFEEIVDQDG